MVIVYGGTWHLPHRSSGVNWGPVTPIDCSVRQSPAPSVRLKYRRLFTQLKPLFSTIHRNFFPSYRYFFFLPSLLTLSTDHLKTHGKPFESKQTIKKKNKQNAMGRSNNTHSRLSISYGLF